MVRRLAPLILAGLLALPFARVGSADSAPETPDSSSATTDAEAARRNETRLSWAVCRVSWKIAWEVPGVGGLALGACLYAIHVDLEDYFSPGR